MTGKKISIETEIRKAKKSRKIVFGKKDIVESLKLGKANLVIICENCFYRDMIENYAKISKVDVVNFEGDAFKLGITCEQPFAVNALSILK